MQCFSVPRELRCCFNISDLRALARGSLAATVTASERVVPMSVHRPFIRYDSAFSGVLEDAPGDSCGEREKKKRLVGREKRAAAPRQVP